MDNWRTPKYIFDYFDDMYHFELDAAADVTNYLCNNYYTEEDSAFNHDWYTAVEGSPSVWLNPPYSNPLPWVQKAHHEAINGCTVVMLLKLDTSTKWFDICRKYATTIYLLGRRVRFLKPDGTPGKSPNFCSCVVVFKKYTLTDGAEIRFLDL